MPLRLPSPSFFPPRTKTSYGILDSMEDNESLKSYTLVERIDRNGARALEVSKKYPKTATALLLHTVIPPPEIEMVYEEVRASLELSHVAGQNVKNMLKSLKPKELAMLSGVVSEITGNFDLGVEAQRDRLLDAQSRRIDHILKTYKDQLHEPIAVAAAHPESYPSPLKYQLQSYQCLSDGIKEMQEVLGVTKL